MRIKCCLYILVIFTTLCCSCASKKVPQYKNKIGTLNIKADFNSRQEIISKKLTVELDLNDIDKNDIKALKSCISIDLPDFNTGTRRTFLYEAETEDNNTYVFDLRKHIDIGHKIQNIIFNYPTSGNVLEIRLNNKTISNSELGKLEYPLDTTPKKDEYFVFFLPGLLGSKLISNNIEIWTPKLDQLSNDEFPKLFLTTTEEDVHYGGNIAPGDVISYANIYPPFETLLNNNNFINANNYSIITYDWRKSFKKINEYISNKITSEIESKQLQDKKIVLIGHSLGGLLANYYVHLAKDKEINAKKIHQVIMISAPLLGSIEAARALYYGAREPLGDKIKLFLDREIDTSVVRSFKSLYYLCPFALGVSDKALNPFDRRYLSESINEARGYWDKWKSLANNNATVPIYNIYSLSNSNSPGTFKFVEYSLREDVVVDGQGDGTVSRESLTGKINSSLDFSKSMVKIHELSNESGQIDATHRTILSQPELDYYIRDILWSEGKASYCSDSMKSITTEKKHNKYSDLYTYLKTKKISCECDLNSITIKVRHGQNAIDISRFISQGIHGKFSENEILCMMIDQNYGKSELFSNKHVPKNETKTQKSSECNGYFYDFSTFQTGTILTLTGLF